VKSSSETYAGVRQPGGKKVRLSLSYDEEGKRKGNLKSKGNMRK